MRIAGAVAMERTNAYRCVRSFSTTRDVEFTHRARDGVPALHHIATRIVVATHPSHGAI